MKNLLSVFAAVAVLSITGCQDRPSEVGSDPGNAVELAAKADDGNVAKPFEARFESTGTNTPDDDCGTGAPPHFLNTQEGEGEGTGLGKMTFHAQFCQDGTDLLDADGNFDGILTAGESVPWHSTGYMIFTAANGDELWTSGGGKIVPSDKPGYVFEFSDPFEFEGGTGRFEGASGSGVTASYVPPAPGPVEHYWSGMLVLPKGND
jgi:hypothetical protein